MNISTCEGCGAKKSEGAVKCAYCGAQHNDAKIARPLPGAYKKTQGDDKTDPSTRGAYDSKNNDMAARERIFTLGYGTPCSARCFRITFLLQTLLGCTGVIFIANGFWFGIAFWLLAIILSITAGARRSLDLGFDRWITFIQLIPGGIILTLIFMARRRFKS